MKNNYKNNKLLKNERMIGLKNIVKSFVKGEQGVNTLEIIIIAAVLVAVAIIFRKALMGFVTNLLNPIFDHYNDVTDGLPPTTQG